MLVGAFNQEKALIGAFSVIVKYSWTFVYTSFEALASSWCSHSSASRAPASPSAAPWSASPAPAPGSSSPDPAPAACHSSSSVSHSSASDPQSPYSYSWYCVVNRWLQSLVRFLPDGLLHGEHDPPHARRVVPDYRRDLLRHSASQYLLKFSLMYFHDLRCCQHQRAACSEMWWFSVFVTSSVIELSS